MIAVPEGGHILRGCTLELTSIQIRGDQWWSLGLEAFGENAALQETLMTVAKQVMAMGEPPDFKLEDSFGYPRWLNLAG
jgi:hypothetical protein